VPVLPPRTTDSIGHAPSHRSSNVQDAERHIGRGLTH
jgi:hypothetical protein